jgi:hypothetical protein
MNINRIWLLLDLTFMTCIVLAGMAVADYFNRDIQSPWVGQTENWSLGAEYNSIGQSIFAGRGFSDPFQSQSGPTAWMPPVYPYLLAILYSLTDFQPAAVVEIVLGFKAISIILTGMIVIQTARVRGFTWLGYLIVPIGLMANFRDYFQTTHDVWILVIVVDLIWLGSFGFWKPTCPLIRSICWGCFGGFCALCSPVLGGAWVVCVVASIFIEFWVASGRSSAVPAIKSFLVVAFISALTVAPWMIRNRVVLGKWIPIKSNSSYEIWQSLCLDSDGVLDSEVLSQHPWPLDGSERAEYLKLGEIRFLELKWTPIFESLRTDPWTAVWKLRNRAIASMAYYFAYCKSDQEKVWPMLFKRMVFPIPFVSLLVCIASRRARSSPAFFYAAILYTSVLAPYVIVSYYDRYSAPLLPVKMIIVILAACVIRQGISNFWSVTVTKTRSWKSYRCIWRCNRQRACQLSQQPRFQSGTCGNLDQRCIQ